jgi:hypothetical protein
MASNKRINKAYVRYDGSGRVIPGSLILNRFKPAVGNWQETPAYLCCNSAPAALPLRMLFSNILEVGGIVGDVTDVANWNTYFDLPTYGTPFTSVTVTGDEVKLYGGSNIIMKESLFDQPDELGTYLLEVDDQSGCVIELEYDVFGYDNNSGCLNITTINLPALVIAGDYAFSYCGRDGGLLTTISLPLLTTVGAGCFSVMNTLTSINLPSCVNLGPTVGNDFVFFNMIGNTITLTVPSALMTADAGNPDGDIAYLQANNTVTVVTV